MQGALEAQVDAALGVVPAGAGSRRPRLSPEDDIDAWAGPTAQEMDQMRAEAATGAAADPSPNPTPNPNPNPRPSLTLTLTPTLTLTLTPTPTLTLIVPLTLPLTRCGCRPHVGALGAREAGGVWRRDRVHSARANGGGARV